MQQLFKLEPNTTYSILILWDVTQQLEVQVIMNPENLKQLIRQLTK